MKRFLLSFILCVSLISSTAFANTNELSVTINGDILEAPAAPCIVNDRTMLPMRAIFESLGAKVTWKANDQIIFATKGDTLITLKINVAEMSVQKALSNENIVVPLDCAPFINEGGHTLVPVRAVAEALQADVQWESETRTVIITTK